MSLCTSSLSLVWHIPLTIHGSKPDFNPTVFFFLFFFFKFSVIIKVLSYNLAEICSDELLMSATQKHVLWNKTAYVSRNHKLKHVQSQIISYITYKVNKNLSRTFMRPVMGKICSSEIDNTTTVITVYC